MGLGHRPSPGILPATSLCPCYLVGCLARARKLGDPEEAGAGQVCSQQPGADGGRERRGLERCSCSLRSALPAWGRPGSPCLRLGSQALLAQHLHVPVLHCEPFVTTSWLAGFLGQHRVAWGQTQQGRGSSSFQARTETPPHTAPQPWPAPWTHGVWRLCFPEPLPPTAGRRKNGPGRSGFKSCCFSFLAHPSEPWFLNLYNGMNNAYNKVAKGEKMTCLKMTRFALGLEQMH